MKTDTQSSLLLLGVGGAGSATVRGIRRAYGSPLRALAVDTDASSGASSDVPFALLGGDRLAGRGAGGLAAEARAAFLDNPEVIDPHLEGVRTAVIVAALGGGTGGGATAEIVKHMAAKGIVSIVFATLPFAFEGEERANRARTALGSIEHEADASVALPLDILVADPSSDDSMKASFERMADTFATAITLFWRIIGKPGYIALDEERLRRAIAGAGRARFATATSQGAGRAEDVLSALSASRLLSCGPRTPAKSIFMGILAGDDLRLSEVAKVADGFRSAYGRNSSFQLGTVNDEEVFAGRLTVAVLVFEESAVQTHHRQKEQARKRKSSEAALSAPDRFSDSEKTMWHDEDLDIPTYLRRNLTLGR